jgi:hypothetical protein
MVINVLKQSLDYDLLFVYESNQQFSDESKNLKCPFEEDYQINNPNVKEDNSSERILDIKAYIDALIEYKKASHSVL